MPQPDNPCAMLARLLDLGEVRAFAPSGSRQSIRWAGAKHGRRFDWWVDLGYFQGMTDAGVRDFYLTTLDLRGIAA